MTPQFLNIFGNIQPPVNYYPPCLHIYISERKIIKTKFLTQSKTESSFHPQFCKPEHESSRNII